MRDDEHRNSGSQPADVRHDQKHWKVSRPSFALRTTSRTGDKDYARHWDYREESVEPPQPSLPGEAVDDGVVDSRRIAHRTNTFLQTDDGCKGTLPVGEQPSALPEAGDFLASVTKASQLKVPASTPMDPPVDGHDQHGSGQGPGLRHIAVRPESVASKAMDIPEQPQRPADKVVWSWARPETHNAQVFSWNTRKRHKSSASRRADKSAASVAKASSASASSLAESAESNSAVADGATSIYSNENSMPAKPDRVSPAPAPAAADLAEKPAASVQVSPTPLAFADQPVAIRPLDTDWDSLVAGSGISEQDGALAGSIADETNHRRRWARFTRQVVAQHKAGVGDDADSQAVSSSAPGGQETVIAQVADKSTSYRASAGVLHAVNGHAAFAFVYLAISVLVIMIGSGMIQPLLMERSKAPEFASLFSDGVTLISALLALTYACISEWSVIRGVDQRGQDAVRWHIGRRMTPAALLALAAVLLLGQGMVYELNKFFNYFCPLLHIPSLASRSMLITAASSPIMIIYALLLVPLSEELVFRGIILNGLRRFGRVFAILTASLLCALLQSDFVSGFWIFLLGLALGYCSLEYGLIWAIGARMVGDLLFSGLPERYLVSAPRTVRLPVLAVALALVLAGLVMFFLHRVSLLEYRRRYRAPKGTYASWRQPWFLFYSLLCLLLTVFKFVPGLL
ncbi:MAG: CPBP family intramembrane metalloprotease [Bifidobacterium sp.]|uniref:CPBP family intramembrane glutamic endopeptidase n=1 Tax=Bifidobacterium apicola TaxID=3230739 RepID=UPI0036F42CBA|nr:CPBP family intramembrane metalloprotease [Bifidobacterium sp.]